jgi:Spy/CpxP family protein refolding chaperone
VLLRAAYDLPPSTAQKAKLDSLHAQLETNEAETGHPFQELKTDLVAGIRAGTLDMAKIKNDESAIERAMQAHIAKEADVLNGIHAALEPSQRKTVADAARTRLAAHTGGPMGHPGGDSTSAQERTNRRLEHMTHDLGLDAEQQKQVGAILAKVDDPMMSAKTQQDDRQKRMDTLLAAFQQDSFDARKLGAPMAGKAMHDGIEQHVTFISQLLPILKPDQREKLASSMDKPWMGRGHGHDDDDDKMHDMH